jgi:hypothetical protein
MSQIVWWFAVAAYKAEHATVGTEAVLAGWYLPLPGGSAQPGLLVRTCALPAVPAPDLV